MLLRLVANFALIGASGILLLLFIKVWIYGSGGFYESNIAILTIETILFLSLILVGIYNLAKEIRWRLKS